jgi:transcriptional antiterminator NusG
MDEYPETQDARATQDAGEDAPATVTDDGGEPAAATATDADPRGPQDEALEEAPPVVGGAADLGEPMTPMDETLQVGVDVPGGQEVEESGPAVLQDASADEAPMPSTVDAIGTGPADAVTVGADQDEPLPGVELGGEEPLAMTDAPAPASEQEEAPATEAPVEAVEPEQVAEAISEEDEIAAAEAEERARSAARDPMRGPGDWYVVHTYAGYENKVKTNLESRIHTMQMEDKIFNVHIPMEDVMEIKGGKKQVVQRKVFPGYLLVKMIYDNDSWYVVRNTPGVTGFVAAGTGSKPTPLSRREVEKILAVKKEEVKPQFRLGFEENDVVRIISGPFADFNGTISEINLDQSKLKVLVNIFDRETPVELSFDQVAKV